MRSNPVPRHWRRWWRSLAPALLVFAVASAATTAAAAMLAGAEQRYTGSLLTRRAQDAGTAINADLRRYVDAMQDLSAAVAAQSDLGSADFATITSRVRPDRLPGVGSVLFTTPSGTTRYARAVAGAGPGTDGAATPATVPDLPAVDQAAANGDDTMAAMALARSTGQVTASRPTGGGAAVRVVLVGPVYAGPSTRDAGGFRGWLLMPLRSATFLTDTVARVESGGLRLVLTDATDPAHPVTVLGRPATGAGGSAGTAGALVAAGGAPARQLDVQAAQRTWRLTATATGALAGGVTTAADEVTFGFGLLIAILLAGVTWLLATSRERALAQVELATGALRADIARRQAVEAQLRDRESELAGFVAVAAHDLKTPLTNVAAYADLLAEVAADDLDATCRGFVDRIAVGTRRMTRLIDDLLDFASADNAQLRPEPVDLNCLVTEVVAEHTTHLGDQRPNIDVGPLPTVTGDPAPLRRLLDNLVGNAIKYVRHGDTAQIAIGARREPDGWLIEVADRGIGIPAEQRQAVFGAFHRDRAADGYPGTGLGLAICKRIVERHGGHIGVEPNPGGGSRFWFTLPYAPPAGRQAAAVERQDRAGTADQEPPGPATPAAVDPATRASQPPQH